MKGRYTFHDYQPRELSLQDAVVEGFTGAPKSIPPKFFYDVRGSELFDAICRQPEYYLPRIETRMLETLAEEIAELTGPGRVVIEPGAGSAAKIRLLLEALRPSAYVPLDISCEYVKSAAHDLVQDYPWLPVHAACVDYTHSLPIPDPTPDSRRLLFFPGSSLGNFEPDQAEAFLRLCSNTAGEDGMLLIGVDTKKAPIILHAAYNDAAGVTAAFNLNLLHRIRRELNVDLVPEKFEHLAFYNAPDGRIEMHLVSRSHQQVRIDGQVFDFTSGETVHTECSYKYSPGEFLAMATHAGFECCAHWLGEDDLFALYLLRNAGWIEDES
ncbi:MAG: L-histidine N(alpha)-methyltransferase [Chromatiales bacterium]|jgi:dimethylhistidine N-methyltransferase